MQNTQIPIYHFFNGDKLEYNLLSVPKDHLLSLSHALKEEYQKRMAIDTAADFRRERALQNDRYMEQCAKTGETPKQLFIDFA